MGEYYIKDGNQEKATFHFQKAHEYDNGKSKNYTRYMYLSNTLILENWWLVQNANYFINLGGMQGKLVNFNKSAI